ncbi:MAG TPA: helix-turn-helix transcriptional regulator [Gemmatimonadales bacterium]|nr:helix-turn-helix transcriptional regulator [Gemmatimonadales bacterium]
MTPGQAVFVPGEWRSLASCLGLSPRECGIVRAVFDGDSEKDAAERLGLSPHTVHTYLWRIYRKLQVQSREQLLVRVFAEFRALPKRPPTSAARKRHESRHHTL